MESSWKLECIECLYPEKKQTQLFWAFEAYKLLLESQTHWQNIQIGLEQKGLLRLSRERLKNLSQLLEQQIQNYKKILKPLGWEKIEANSFYSYLNSRPGSSFLAENIDNLFRDWCWGDHENKSSLEMITQTLEDNPLQGDLMVLGSGAGRLAYDLHRLFGLNQTTLVDYNPLLMLLAQKIISGEELSLVEFPIVPSHSADFAMDRKLKSPRSLKDGINYILADLKDPLCPLPKSQNILTPWLIDVVQIDYRLWVQKMNSWLPLGGTWINFGPLGFNNPLLSDYYSYEEVLHLTEKGGFKIKKMDYKRIPYMQSPSSNSHRQEKVLCFVAEKIEEISPESISGIEKLPWEKDPDQPIEIPVVEMRLEAGFQLNAHICKLLKEKPSYLKLLEQLSADYPIPQDQLSFMLTQILKNIHYQSLANPLDHS